MKLLHIWPLTFGRYSFRLVNVFILGKASPELPFAAALTIVLINCDRNIDSNSYYSFVKVHCILYFQKANCWTVWVDNASATQTQFVSIRNTFTWPKGLASWPDFQVSLASFGWVFCLEHLKHNIKVQFLDFIQQQTILHKNSRTG